ncbi:MAG: hypothetical protein JWM02_1712 [Frankiales bacterium]|nr:hypothetical protein [Frankiales bacterium]
MVHTVSSADPLEDLPLAASSVLTRALLTPVHGDLGGALERCEAVRELLDRWQDAFFAALPLDVDLEEEARWAAEAGLSLEDIEAAWEDDPWEEDDDWEEGADAEQTPGQLGLEQIDLSELSPLEDEPPGLLEAAPRDGAPLDDDLVAELEVAVVLLPLRVRLEALVAAAALVDDWADLLADHEKCLGHLVLRHGVVFHDARQTTPHEAVADQHAILHAGIPGHFSPGS